jgi:hypothetical protein
MKKNLKVTLFSGLLLSFVTSISCIPIAFQGLPTALNRVATDTTRQGLCNLLLSVGGNQDDVQRCLTATTVSQADIDRLCALSSNLTADQRTTVIDTLTSLGVNVQDSCPIARVGAGTPTATPTPEVVTGEPTPTPRVTTTPSPGTVTTEPTSTPSPSATPTSLFVSTPVPTSTSGTGGGGSGSGSTGCGSSTCGSSGGTGSGGT